MKLTTIPFVDLAPTVIENPASNTPTSKAGLSPFISILAALDPAVGTSPSLSPLALPATNAVAEEPPIEIPDLSAISDALTQLLAPALIFQPLAPSECASSKENHLSENEVQLELSASTLTFIGLPSANTDSTPCASIHEQLKIPENELPRVSQEDAITAPLDVLEELRAPAKSASEHTANEVPIKYETLRAATDAKWGTESPSLKTPLVISESKLISPQRNVEYLKKPIEGIENNWLSAGNQGLANNATYSTNSEGGLTTFSSEKITEQVTYWVNQKLQNAVLKLDGEGQDSVEVHVSIQGNEANVTFHSDKATTRDLLEGSVLQLKDMMEKNGLSLSSVSVGGSGLNDKQPRDPLRPDKGWKYTKQTSSTTEIVKTKQSRSAQTQMVDLFV